ncbi:hypothetical protein CCACVL1_06368 [Corchorus capsularis]|uniref:Uncharacterized protein n=1 Tax=Corchorus capsularis TaxID=210143 RepID=A0A1R3JFY4_COCAP|nr:hypothetical protein CCACVL1_06368 [Corchorus capsularis]
MVKFFQLYSISLILLAFTSVLANKGCNLEAMQQLQNLQEIEGGQVKCGELKVLAIQTITQAGGRIDHAEVAYNLPSLTVYMI